jgi:hypothetical protein
VLIEVIGYRILPLEVFRDDVEDLMAATIGSAGRVTGAGFGGESWNVDVELSVGPDEARGVLLRMAAALVAADLGWVLLRPGGEAAGVAASDLTA